MTITVYSTTTCPYCGRLKEYFKEKNLTYIEKLVDQDPNAQKEMEQISNGFMGVPFVSVTKDDNTTETVVGFDKGKLDQVLGQS
ncbi:glutaredoxin family protein [Candidatus Microgenomates bacterium]|nr:glutaredoxin family protein [Candidatus Microgenomates bacterium]